MTGENWKEINWETIQLLNSTIKSKPVNNSRKKNAKERFLLSSYNKMLKICLCKFIYLYFVIFLYQNYFYLLICLLVISLSFEKEAIDAQLHFLDGVHLTQDCETCGRR